MTIRVFWSDSTKHLIRQVFDTTWTWHEFYDAQNDAKALAMEVQYPIAVTLELAQNGAVPSQALTHGKNFVKQRPPNVYCTAIVTQNRFIHHLFTLFKRIHPSASEHFVIVNSFEKACVSLNAVHDCLKDQLEENRFI